MGRADESNGCVFCACFGRGNRACGAGTSTLLAAQHVGTEGHVTGIDISETLLKLARDRSAQALNVGYDLADAQIHAFAPAKADALISRFGLMFFDDPDQAFANLTHALRPGARMVFATWGPIPQNPYFTAAAEVAKRVLGPMPKSDPDAPGPFALRDRERVRGILSRAGLADLSAEEIQLDLTPQGSAHDLALLMCEIGPAQRALAHFEVDAAGREALIEALTEALQTYETPAGLRLPACINFFSARKPA
ncbi:MAG: methyltransferase domain-containing protein [Pseudomonadota bacterium]